MHIWSTHCAADQFINCAAFDELRNIWLIAQRTCNRVRVWVSVRLRFRVMVRLCLALGLRIWPKIWPNVQINQMRLTETIENVH